MNEILAVFGQLYIYRHAVVMCAAAASGVACMYILSKMCGLRPLSAALSSFFSLLVCPVLARLVYWYCCSSQYSSFGEAMTAFFDGGFSIAGALIGGALSVFLAAKISKEENLGRLFDSACASGALTIATGRLAAFFTDDDKSRIIFTDGRLCSLPFAVLVTDKATGMQSWRFATFIFEALAAYIIFLILIVMIIKRPRNGEAALMFCVMYGASQIVLESTRYDSLFLRSNGFVSLMQILGAVMLAIGAALLSRMAIKRTGYKRMYLWCWLIMLALTAVTGFFEYFVQRHGDLYAVSYLIMGACMTAVCLVGGAICMSAIQGEEA